MDANQGASTVETSDTVTLPVLVEWDNVHNRVCASILHNGKPDRSLHGEEFIGDSKDLERAKKLAIGDLQRKVMSKLREVSGR